MRSTVTVLTFFVLAFIAACDSRENRSAATPETPQEGIVSQSAPKARPLSPPAVKTQTTPALRAPIKIQTVEVASDAIPLWRAYRGIKPTFVMLTDHPFLQPIPEAQAKEVDNLVQKGSPEDFVRTGRFSGPNPTLLLQHAVSAALRNHFFSEIIWILPARTEVKTLDLDDFRKLASDAGILNAAELESLTLNDNVIEGEIRGVPLKVATPHSLPKLEGPVILHMDLTFFPAIYKTEISTPIYQLVQETLTAVRNTNWQLAAATLSFSTGRELVDLRLRFLGYQLAEIFQNPDLLDQALPESWLKRGNIFYLENFFQPEKMLEIAQNLEKVHPEDPGIKFELYHIHRLLRADVQAEQFLDQAVNLDRAYAEEYLIRAYQELENAQLNKAIDLFEKAARVFPDNHLIPLQMAIIHLELGQKKTALPLIRDLRNQTWSPVFHSDIPPLLADLWNRAQS